jgi:predicted neutral ceramidase superfamily lipid hydrolase
LKDLDKTVQGLVDKAQKNETDQRIDIMVKVASALYDKAVAYTNIIILAGYAAFFTVWSTMKAKMSHTEMLVVAFCITFSLVFFVFWEVTKMIVNSKSLKGLLNVLKAPRREFDQRLAELQKADQRLNIRLLRFWIVILVFTVVPGLIAAAVLLWSFGRQLWGLI